MSSSDWVNIIGWFVSFILGTISATFVQNYFKQRKIIAWAIVGELHIIKTESFSGFNVPIKILIDNQEETSISVVKIRIGNKGNTEITNLSIKLDFGNPAIVYGGEFAGNLGVYRNSLRLSKSGNSATVDIDYINPNQDFDVDFYIGKYVIGNVYADMAKAGVELRQTKFTQWDLLTKTILESLAESIPFVNIIYVISQKIKT
jgi:hypothetical protein